VNTWLCGFSEKNPLRLTDPTGLEPHTAATMAVYEPPSDVEDYAEARETAERMARWERDSEIERVTASASGQMNSELAQLGLQAASIETEISQVQYYVDSMHYLAANKIGGVMIEIGKAMLQTIAGGKTPPGVQSAAQGLVDTNNAWKEYKECLDSISQGRIEIAALREEAIGIRQLILNRERQIKNLALYY
jgi:hypothetical protein